MRPFWLALLVLVPGCATPVALSPTSVPAMPAPPASLPVDVLTVGALAVAKLDYDVRVGLVTNGAFAPAYADRLRGDIHYPRDGQGPFPLVVLLHGMHATCSVPGVTSLVGVSDACPETPATSPQDSYKGYDYLAEPLASHGFVVVSIDANQANDRDTTARPGPQLRGDLVLRTLDALVDVNASGTFGSPFPGGDMVALKGKIDLSRIGIMGHSRGGEGVAAAYVENQARSRPYPIKALFALAPVDFARELPRHVPLAVLLPSCDGDVSDLEGAWYYDDTRNSTEDDAPRSTLLVMGANHNYYNTIWTGDDASWLAKDDYCARDKPTRLSPADEQRTGIALVDGFFRLYLAHETALRPIFTGDATLPTSACPRGNSTCPDLLHVAYTPGAASRTTLYEAGKAAQPRLDGFDSAGVCGPYDGAPGPLGVGSSASSRPRCAQTVHASVQLNLTWSKPATVTFDGPGDASGATMIAFRIAVVPKHNTQDQDLRVVLTDAAGHSASTDARSWSRSFFVPTSKMHAQAVLNSVRIPLAAFPGIDLSRVASAQLVFDKTPSGTVTLTDVEFQR